MTTTSPTGRPFASTADTEAKKATLEELAPGAYGYTAEGDPNVGCVIGDDGVLVVDARATPVMAEEWIGVIRTLTDKPIRYVFLTHYHAVRVLGASAFGAHSVISSAGTAALIDERGQFDMDSEIGRFPRLFAAVETIPGLTRPTVTFTDEMTLDLGGRTVVLKHLGRGHTEGDAVVWLPDDRVLFAGDLVEAQAALYMGDAFLSDWKSRTLDRVAALGAQALVGGRGPVVRGADVATAIEDTRAFISTSWDCAREVVRRNGTLKEAFDATREALGPRYGAFPIFEHCLPFNVQRTWDEVSGRRPRIWTAERDRQVWAELQG